MSEQSRTANSERLVVLSCAWEHHHFWPADLEPYPSECMAKVASLPSGEWPTCGKHLHVSRYVTGEQNGRTWTEEEHDAECANGGCPGYEFHRVRRGDSGRTEQ